MKFPSLSEKAHQAFASKIISGLAYILRVLRDHLRLHSFKSAFFGKFLERGYILKRSTVPKLRERIANNHSHMTRRVTDECKRC